MCMFHKHCLQLKTQEHIHIHCVALLRVMCNAFTLRCVFVFERKKEL